MVTSGLCPKHSLITESNVFCSSQISNPRTPLRNIFRLSQYIACFSVSWLFCPSRNFQIWSFEIWLWMTAAAAWLSFPLTAKWEGKCVCWSAKRQRNPSWRLWQTSRVYRDWSSPKGCKAKIEKAKNTIFTATLFQLFPTEHAQNDWCASNLQDNSVGWVCQLRGEGRKGKRRTGSFTSAWGRKRQRQKLAA